MEKLDHQGKPIITAKQRKATASTPIASIDLSETNAKLIANIVHKYNLVSRFYIY